MENEEQDQTTADLARVLYEAAALRSGYALKDSADFAGRIERMLRLSLGVDESAKVCKLIDHAVGKNSLSKINFSDTKQSLIQIFK